MTVCEAVVDLLAGGCDEVQQGVHVRHDKIVSGSQLDDW